MPLNLETLLGKLGKQTKNLLLRDESLLKDPNATAGRLEQGVDALLLEESIVNSVTPPVVIAAEVKADSTNSFRKVAREKSDAFYCPDGMTQEEFVAYASQPRMTQDILKKIAKTKNKC
ncbi:hypothetical protein KBD69_03385 [Candidatus Woesebacteria bacterium]|nr:hypothetical protein [Candidatus Woesebacteria bacterium]